MMSALNELITYCTILVTNGGWLVGFILVLLESFLPILPLGAFVALNVNAFGFIPGITISWIATTIGSFLTYILFFYVSNKIIYKVINQNKQNKIIDKISVFKKIKLTHLVLIMTVPFAPSCFINLLAALAAIPKDKYLISLIIGKALMIIFWGYIGKSFIESMTNIKAIIFILLILLIAYLITKIVSKKFKIE